MLYWVSLDGLNKPIIEKIVQKLPDPHPHGFKWLLKHPHQNDHLKINDVPITASSHIGTITCSPPSVTGVYGNQVYTSKGLVSAFDFLFPTDTFPAHLTSKGYTVASVHYPALDNRKPNRAFSYGEAYGNQTGKVQIIEVTPGNPTVFTYMDEKQLLKCDTNLTWRVIQKGRKQGTIIPVEPCKFVITTVHENGVQPQWFYDKVPLKTTYYQKHPYSVLKDYPKAFAKALDAELDHQIGMISNVTRTKTPDGKTPDIFLIYFSHLDVIQHHYYDNPPKAVLKHLERFDKALGKLWKEIKKKDELLIMGDHGFAPVTQRVSLSLEDKYVWQNEGTVLYGYEKESASNKKPENYLYTPQKTVWLEPGVFAVDNNKVVGVHGYENTNASMNTWIIMDGPKLSKIDLQKVSLNTEVAKSIGKALNYPMNLQCQN